MSVIMNADNNAKDATRMTTMMLVMITRLTTRFEADNDGGKSSTHRPVSYTHLTLPTKA